MLRMTSLGTFEDSATSTSPLGNAWIHRGCFRPVANALTLSPGAATGVCPSVQPLAVGILSVGMLPCGLASGIVGAEPHAGSGEPCVNRRIWSAAPPIRATPRAKTVEKLNALFPWYYTDHLSCDVEQVARCALLNLRPMVASYTI